MQRTKSFGSRPRSRLALMAAVLVASCTFVSGQLAVSPLGSTQALEEGNSAPSTSPFAPWDSHSLENPYVPITPSESLRWFLTNTIGPAHMAGVAFVAAGGTAVNRPGEYGPHYKGFTDRFGIGMAGSFTSAATEAGVGVILREDPHYFRAPQQAFKSRVGNVARLAFLVRTESGRSEPAYARYIGIVGGNFLSNSWRVQSEANTKDALFRSSEGFAGRMAANAFKEFWPDVKRRVFRKYSRPTNSGTQVLTQITR
jgi:hypothetical protein